ncbi:unnamed protein product [Cochlearia groenlandica]
MRSEVGSTEHQTYPYNKNTEICKHVRSYCVTTSSISCDKNRQHGAVASASVLCQQMANKLTCKSAAILTHKETNKKAEGGVHRYFFLRCKLRWQSSTILRE